MTPLAPLLDLTLLYRVLVEASQDAVVIVDQAGIVLLLNPAAERLFGYSAAEVSGQSLRQLVPERLREGLGRDLTARVASGELRRGTQVMAFRIRTEDGREVVTDASFGEALLGGRQVYFGIIRDITERVAADQAIADCTAVVTDQSVALEQQIEETLALTKDLELSNEELRRLHGDLDDATVALNHGMQRIVDILDALSEAVWALDAEWRWTYLNPAAALALRADGHDPLAMPGRVLWDALPHLVGTRFERELRQAMVTGEAARFEERITGAAGAISTRIVPSPGAVVCMMATRTGERRSVHPNA